MNRLELIQQLESIQYNIQIVEQQVNQKITDTTYYQFFGYGNESDFHHLKEIRTKALAFWVRKFNRALKQLKY